MAGMLRSLWTMAATVLREALARDGIARLPEPMVMDGAEQVDAYATSGGDDGGIMAVSNLFHAAHAASTIRGAQAVVDLGCGPATQLVRIARLCPDTAFTGIELSPRMRATAHAHIAANGLSNVRVVAGDITQLDGCADQGVDAVISTMTLHHLPDASALDACLAQVQRVLRPQGSVYLADFARLRGAHSIDAIARLHADILPPVVVDDYGCSLRAAFSVDELRAAARARLCRCSVHATGLASFMAMVRTPGRGLEPPARALLAQGVARLPPRLRRDLFSLRAFFRLGGLRDDPFQAIVA